MGINISKHYSSIKSHLIVFKRGLNFLPNDPHQSTVLAC